MEFNSQAYDLALHYAGRVKYWEVWNEENLGGGAEGGGRVDEIRFAPLLKEAYDAIVAGNPNAQVLSGGLASAWGDSYNYFTELHTEWNEKYNGVKPFHLVGIHPYTKGRDNYGVDPDHYLRAQESLSDAGQKTILGKFVAFINNPDKKIWVTEIGWNRNLDRYPDSRPAICDPQCNRAVTFIEQALYLHWGFDILFKEVPLSNDQQAVLKVFWYQYQDTAITLSQSPNASESGAWAIMKSRASDSRYLYPVDTAGTTDWWFGLYDGNKQPNERVQCVFAMYPEWGTCLGFTYLPNIGSQTITSASSP